VLGQSGIGKIQAPQKTKEKAQIVELHAHEQSRQTQTSLDKQTVLHFFIKLAVFIAVIWLVFTFVFGIRQVSGETMYPALRDGDLVLFYRIENDYKIGDVVTFRRDGTTYYGRIVAQGGDIVELDEDGQLLVNGNVQQEKIFYPTEPQNDDVTYPCTVDEDSYFLLCDYRTVGFDSRTYGTVPRKDLDGSIITVLRHRGI
jgi:signal peptidase I